MKRKNNIYIILTYLFFIYPPFIWGLVSIYQEGNYGKEHITSLIINLIIIAVIVLVCGLFISKGKLHIPSEKEIKHLIFGFIGNIVIYFYTFQNLMNIDNIVTIYLVIIIVLGVHYILLSKRLQAIELWILMPIFLILDYWYLIGTGCGFTDSYSCHESVSGTYLYIIYSIIIITSLGYYAYRVYLLKQWNILRYMNLVLIIVLSILFQNNDWLDEKLTLTISIMLPFFTIVDFIISIVNKKYSHKMLFHYIRMYTILFLCIMIGMLEFFYGNADNEMLIQMVVITYVSLFINIFRYLLKVDVIKKTSIDKGIVIGICNSNHLELIKEQFGESKAAYISLNIDDYALVALKDGKVIGFMSTISKPLTSPLEMISEASVEIIEILPEYRKQGIATKLIEQTEKHFTNEGKSQIRAWTLSNNSNYINLWNKLNYCLSPTIFHFEKQERYLDGYHFIKRL